MHVKRIHDMVEKLTKCAETEMEKGIENIDTEEIGKVTDMIKDLCEAEYYAKISKAMDESEYGIDYDWEGRKGYRGQMRDSKGRYMSRRGYEIPIMMYDENREEMERLRNMDRPYGKMSYSDGYGGQYSSRMQRSAHEGRSGEARRGYMETKEMHKGNTVEDKQHKMKSLEDYAKSLTEDVTDMVSDMSAEEKNLLRSKLQTLAQKVQ